MINKKNLSKSLVNQINRNNEIEQPKITEYYFPLVKTDERESVNFNINVTDNTQLMRPISNFCSSNFNSEFEINNNFNSQDNSFSFSSDCNSFNRALLSNSFNSKLDKSPALSCIKMNVDVDEDLPNFGCERLIYEKKEDNIKKSEIKLNINEDKQNKTSNNKNYSNKNSNYSNKNCDYEMYDSEKKYFNDKRDRERKRAKTPDKNVSKDVQILNTFQLEYKKNKKKEIIIRKCIEIPYLININKTAVDMKEIQKYMNKKPKQNNIMEKKENVLAKTRKSKNFEDSSSYDIYSYDNLNKTYIKNTYCNGSFFTVNEKRKKGKSNTEIISSKTDPKKGMKYSEYQKRKAKTKDKKKKVTSIKKNSYTYYNTNNNYTSYSPNMIIIK